MSGGCSRHRLNSSLSLVITNQLTGKPSTRVWVDPSGFEVNSSTLQLRSSTMILPPSVSAPLPLSISPYTAVKSLKQGKQRFPIWGRLRLSVCMLGSAWKGVILVMRYNCAFYYLLGRNGNHESRGSVPDVRTKRSAYLTSAHGMCLEHETFVSPPAELSVFSATCMSGVRVLPLSGGTHVKFSLA